MPFVSPNSNVPGYNGRGNFGADRIAGGLQGIAGQILNYFNLPKFQPGQKGKGGVENGAQPIPKVPNGEVAKVEEFGSTSGLR